MRSSKKRNRQVRFNEEEGEPVRRRELIRFRSIYKKHSRILSIRGNVRGRDGNREILLATRSITSENCRYTLQSWFSRSLPPLVARTNVDILVGKGDVAETVRSF